MKHQKKEILDQFSKQANRFAHAEAISDKRALDLLLTATNANVKDTVLDIACGPGIVTCAFAEKTRHATGIDIVPAMIEQARSLQEKRKLNNVSWKTGDVTTLPFEDASFSIVSSRYSFHHLENPGKVLSEMKRVCKPNGNIALIDVIASEDPEKAERFNEMEKLRDSSHVRALPLSEMKLLFSETALSSPKITYYKLKLELESFLQRSFPKDKDEFKIRSLIQETIENDQMGIDAYYEENSIMFTYPIAILVGSKGS